MKTKTGLWLFPICLALLSVVPPASVEGGTRSHLYDCGTDWDGDVDTVNDAGDMLACLDAAKAFVTTASDGTTDAIGSDNAVDIFLPDGYLDFCDDGLPGGNPCPYTLEPGMNLRGVKPRLMDVAGQDAQDLDMRPNGGTWIDGNSTNSSGGIFTGSQIRGIELENLGFYNFEDALVFGAPGEDGIAFSSIRDVYCVGQAAGTDSCIWLTNQQHVRIDHVKAYNCEECFRFTQQHHSIQFGNSVISDLYAYGYRTTSTDTHGIWMECNHVAGGTGAGNLLNYTTFVRPQVNIFDLGGVASNVFLDGSPPPNGCHINAAHFIGVDVEGGTEALIKMRSVTNTTIDIAASSPSATTVVDIDNTCFDNILFSSARSTVTPNPGVGRNQFYGFWDGVYEDQDFTGLQHDTVAGFSQVMADGGRMMGQWVGNKALANSKEVFKIVPAFQSTDTTPPDGPDFTSLMVKAVNLLWTPEAESDLYGVQSWALIQGDAINNRSDDTVMFRALLDGILSTGTGVEVDDVSMFRAELGGGFGGANWTVNNMDMFEVPPLDPSYPGGSFDTVNAVHIEDLSGLGTNNAAILVDPQSGVSATKGNVVMAGGDWNDGHLVVGSVHVWDDSGTLRFSNTAPSGPAGGAAFGVSSIDETGNFNWSGAHDFGDGAIEIPNSASPVTDAAGEIALDTSISDHEPLLQYHDGGKNRTVVAIDAAELPALDDEIVKYDAATDRFVLEPDAGSASLATHAECIYIENPSASTRESVWRSPVDVTITDIWCETDGAPGTATLNFRRDDGTPADICTADVVCDSDEQQCATGGSLDPAERALADGDRVDLNIVSTANSPTALSVCFEYR